MPRWKPLVKLRSGDVVRLKRTSLLYRVLTHRRRKLPSGRWALKLVPLGLEESGCVCHVPEDKLERWSLEERKLHG